MQSVASPVMPWIVSTLSEPHPPYSPWLCLAFSLPTDLPPASEEFPTVNTKQASPTPGTPPLTYPPYSCSAHHNQDAAPPRGLSRM
jgi:hypothetical protein